MKITQLRYDGRWAVRSKEMEKGAFVFLEIKEQMQALLHKLFNTKMKCGVLATRSPHR
jgi:hypothetical protein